MSKFFVMILLTVIALSFLFTVIEMPLYGRLDVPDRQGGATHYLTRTVRETRALNILSAILVDYRAYDTLIETTVLFTATAGVLALAHDHRKKGDE